MIDNFLVISLLLKYSSISSPTGILCDDTGHLLVADGNGRLLVLSEAGQFLGVALQGGKDMARVQNIRRFHDFIIVIKTSSRQSPNSGRVIWYQLKGRNSSETSLAL